MIDRYSSAAHAALDRAVEEARNLGHGHIGPEHLVLALLRLAATGASGLMPGVVHGDVLMLMAEVVEDGVGQEPVVPRQNSEFRAVRERAFREGLRRAHRYVTTEDLLMGILADGHNLGARILNQLGVSYDEASHQIGSLWGRSANLELSDDVDRLTKENAALRAAVAEMRPVFDAAVVEANMGTPDRQVWAKHTARRIGAGEFGEPRKVG